MFAGLEKMYGPETLEKFGFSNQKNRRWYVSRISDYLGDVWSLLYVTPCGLIFYSHERDEWGGCPWEDVYRVAVEDTGWHLVYKADE